MKWYERRLWQWWFMSHTGFHVFAQVDNCLDSKLIHFFSFAFVFAVYTLRRNHLSIFPRHLPVFAIVFFSKYLSPFVFYPSIFVLGALLTVSCFSEFIQPLHGSFVLRFSNHTLGGLFFAFNDATTLPLNFVVLDSFFVVSRWPP